MCHLLDLYHNSTVQIVSPLLSFIEEEEPGVTGWEQWQQELGVGTYSQPSGWQHCMLGDLSNLNRKCSQEQRPRTKALPWEGTGKRPALQDPGLKVATLALDPLPRWGGGF